MTVQVPGAALQRHGLGGAQSIGVHLVIVICPHPAVFHQGAVEHIQAQVSINGLSLVFIQVNLARLDKQTDRVAERTPMFQVPVPYL